MANPIEAEQRGLTREDTWEEANSYLPEDFDVKCGLGINAAEVLEAIGIDQQLIQTALAGLENFTDSLGAILDIVSAAVEFIGTLLGIAFDLFEGFTAALQAVVTSVINLFTGISISTMFHFPQTDKSRKNPDEILYDLGSAYLDKEDTNRPITVGENYAVTLIALWSLPNLAAIKQVFETIKQKFSDFSKQSEAQLNRLNINKEVYNAEDVLAQTGAGLAPDFGKKVDMLDFLTIRDVVKTLYNALNLLQAKKQRFQALSDIVELARRRISDVNTQLQNILNIIESIASLFAFGDANALFLLSGSGKAEDFSRAIINSPNHPNYPRSSLNSTIVNPHTDKGILTAEDREIGKKGLYSGAVLIHAQVADPLSDADRVYRLFSSLFKETNNTFDNAQNTTSTRIQTNWDRIPKSDQPPQFSTTVRY